MEKQLIISVGREFGSAGHEIAARLAAKYDLPLYDHNLLDCIAEERAVDVSVFREYDEMKRNKLLTRTVKGMNSCPAHNIATMQFDFLKKKAESGESFVIVGRCSEYVLRGHEALVSIFVLGDMDKKLERIMTILGKSKLEAKLMLADKDRKRKKYHNSYSDIKWGDSRGYDLSINSSKLELDECVRVIADYIDARRK